MLESGHFLNDVVVTPAGDVLVTGSRAGVVYRANLESDTLDPFVRLGDLGSPNGIATSPEAGSIFVAVGAEVIRVDASKRTFQFIVRPEAHKGVIDGLYFFRGSLIAVQPWVEGAHVVRLVLSASFDEVERTEPLVAGHPALSQPTAGVVVAGELYFIANCQLQVFRRMWSATARAPENASSLVEPTILKTRLPTP